MMIKSRWMPRFIAMVVLLNLLFASITQARWANFEDAPVEFAAYSRDVMVYASGVSEETISQHVIIVNELGRTEYGIERLVYNSNIQHIEILEAKTVYQDKEYPVEKESIEIKPLASDGTGFDQMTQVLVSFPQVAPGSHLFLKYKITTKKQAMANYFATDFIFGLEGIWSKADIHVKSEIPFHTLINDPKTALDVQQRKDQKHHFLDITLKAPLYQSSINEPDHSQIPVELRTWVSLSTVAKFEDIGKNLAENFTKVIREPLPPLLEEIKKSAQEEPNPTTQINKVTSMLAEKIRYMGDWRSIEGRYAPRSLKTITESGYGDCKDFCATTAAILSSLGYKAHVAMVNRRHSYLAPQKPLPSLGLVNHVIVKVTHKDGKISWIDPTNTVSMADGLFPDIADRPAIILDEKTPSYEMIPPIEAAHARFEIENVMDLKSDSLLHTQGTVHIFGEKTLLLAGATLSNSPQAVEEALIRNLSGEATPISKEIKLPDLRSRIASPDISFPYAFEQENAVLFSNEGNGIYLDTAWGDGFLNASLDQVGTLAMGHPSTLRRKLTLKDVHVNNLENLNFDISTPWVQAKRECRSVANGIEIDEHVTILKSFISADDVKTKAFSDFRNQLKKYCTKVAVIIDSKKTAP